MIYDSKIYRFLEYLFAVIFGRPYFGPMVSGHKWYVPARDKHLEKIAAGERARLGRELSTLEIGSDAGHSAVIWARYGCVTCVDKWENDGAFALFHRNNRLTGNRMLALRGNSDVILRALTGQFDIVYVDGDHSYDNVLRDMLYGSRLVRTGGILCGDDLELQVSEFHKDVNKIRAAAWHPGMAWAAWHFFGKSIYAKDGFWAMQRIGISWEWPHES